MKQEVYFDYIYMQGSRKYILNKYICTEAGSIFFKINQLRRKSRWLDSSFSLIELTKIECIKKKLAFHKIRLTVRNQSI